MKTFAFPFLLLAMMGAAAPAHAQQRAAVAACRADMERLCSREQPGAGRVMACLRRNETSLQPACREQLGVLEPCAQELRRLCGDPASAKSLHGCATAQRERLSPQCKTLVP